MKDREKELKYLIYLKTQLIKQEKKELQQLRNSLTEYQNTRYNSGNKKRKRGKR